MFEQRTVEEARTNPLPLTTKHNLPDKVSESIKVE